MAAWQYWVLTTFFDNHTFRVAQALQYAMKAAEVAAEGSAAAGDGGDGNAAAANGGSALASGSASSEYMENLVAAAKKAVRWVF